MLSRRSVLYLVCGGLLLVGGALAYSAVPGEDYRVAVTATDADSAEKLTSPSVMRAWTMGSRMGSSPGVGGKRGPYPTEN